MGLFSFKARLNLLDEDFSTQRRLSEDDGLKWTFLPGWDGIRVENQDGITGRAGEHSG